MFYCLKQTIYCSLQRISNDNRYKLPLRGDTQGDSQAPDAYRGKTV